MLLTTHSIYAVCDPLAQYLLGMMPMALPTENYETQDF